MIHPFAVGRTVHSVWTEGRNLYLLFTDRTELVVTWGETGPELRECKSLRDLPAVAITEGLISRQLAGKTISVAHTNEDGDLLLRTECGHEAVIVYVDGPIMRSMNVRVLLPMVAGAGMFGSFG